MGSRRACEALVAAGRVTVDGEVVTELGTCIRPGAALVKLDGKPVRREPKTYIILHKPRDVIVTCRDPRDRKTFKDLLPDLGVRLFPVGRLDRDSEGLLLLTNDGDLAFSLTHPSRGVEKTYLVWVSGPLTPEGERQMLSGIASEGEVLRAAAVRQFRQDGPGECYEVRLREGKKRQIRRMFAALGLDVLKLLRIGIGPLWLGTLSCRQWRRLVAREVEALRKAVAPVYGSEAAVPGDRQQDGRQPRREPQRGRASDRANWGRRER